MTLPSSGPINFSDVNIELGNSSTSTLVIPSSKVRTLTGVSSGPIVMPTDFYNKSYLAFNTPSTVPPNSFSVYLNSVAVNSSGLHVAISGNGALYYSTSTDGNIWSTLTQIPSGTFAVSGAAIAVNAAGLFVIIGYRDFGGNTGVPVYLTSTNGTTWSSITQFTGLSNCKLNGLTVDSSGRFVAVGTGPNQEFVTAYADSLNTTTLSSWTVTIGSNAIGSRFNARSVCVNSSTGQFVAVGYNAYNYPTTSISTGGATWAAPATMNGSTTIAIMTGVAVNSSGLYVAVGYNYANGTGSGYPVYSTSTNGTTWTTPAVINGTTTFAYMMGIAVNSSGLFVAVGYNVSGGYPVYTISGNGSTWSTPATMGLSATATNIVAVTANPSGKFVAVGYYSSNGFAAYATSQ